MTLDLRVPGKKLRVLTLVDRASAQGGAERFAIGLAQHLPRDRFEPWVCSTRGAAPEVVKALTAAEVQYVNLARRGKADIHRFVKLASLLRRERFDVLHAHKFGSNAWGSTFGRAFGVPVIIAHEHNWSYSGDRLRVWLDRWVISRLATRFVAVSAANRERMIALEHVPAEKILVLPTAYIAHSVREGNIRAELGLSPQTPLIAVAAVLREEKALEILIDAHAKVLHTFSDAHLVIAGAGPCRDALERQVDELGLRSRVHFLGSRRDITAILTAADLGAMSSDWEGMPLFVFECMAAHTPLVATSVGGLPEIVDDGRTGLLVPPRDPVALADAVTGLLADPERRLSLASAAAERLDEFRIGAVAQRFAELYEILTHEAASRRSNKSR